MAGQLTKRGNGTRSLFPAQVSLRRELDDFFNRMWGGDTEWIGGDAMHPTMDLSETEDAYRATLELPGVSSDDIDIQVNGNLLTVTGERKEEKEDKGRAYHRTERSYGSFARTVTLPCEIKEDGISAKLEDGLLKIELPKAEEAKPRKIKVEN